MSWSRQFDDHPVLLPDGRQILTLRDAAANVQQLPDAEQQLDEWQTAVHCLIGAAEERNFVMHARIGMQRATKRTLPAPAPGRRRTGAKPYGII